MILVDVRRGWENKKHANARIEFYSRAVFGLFRARFGQKLPILLRSCLFYFDVGLFLGHKNAVVVLEDIMKKVKAVFLVLFSFSCISYRCQSCRKLPTSRSNAPQQRKRTNTNSQFFHIASYDERPCLSFCFPKSQRSKTIAQSVEAKMFLLPLEAARTAVLRGTNRTYGVHKNLPGIHLTIFTSSIWSY